MIFLFEVLRKAGSTGQAAAKDQPHGNPHHQNPKLFCSTSGLAARDIIEVGIWHKWLEGMYVWWGRESLHLSPSTKLMDRSQCLPVSRSGGLPEYIGLVCPIINCLDFQYDREGLCEERETEATPEFSGLSEMEQQFHTLAFSLWDSQSKWTFGDLAKTRDLVS